MNDLLGGHVPIAFGVLPPALGNIAAGKLRAVAVTSKKRFSLLPDVPTFDESGLPGFEAVLHYGLLAPAGTPKEIVDRLSEEVRQLVDTPEVRKQIHNEGGDPMTSTPAEYAADIDMAASTASGGGAAAVKNSTTCGKGFFSFAGALSSVAITIGAPHRCVTL